MLENEDIICFSSIDWDFIWQGHQEIMSRLACSGNRVLFIENTGVRSPGIKDTGRLFSRIKNWRKGYKGIRKVEDNLYVLSPIILPFPYSKWARFINRILLNRLIQSWSRSVRLTTPIIWTFLPSPLTIELIGKMSYKSLIYYCIDSFEKSSRSASRIRSYENKLIKKADLIFVTSERLKERCEPFNEKIYKFPFTVNYEKFSSRLENDTDSTPSEYSKISGPVIGYVGGLHRWLDLDLIVQVATACPDINFVFIGPEQESMDRLRKMPNIYLWGAKDHDRLPVYLKGFDVGWIPYRITDYTQSVYPTKLNEYLAVGLPVLSTRLLEIELFQKDYPGIVDILDIDKNPETQLRDSVKSRYEKDMVKRRQSIAMDNSWTARLDKMQALVSEQISDYRTDTDIRWRNQLTGLLNNARKRLAVSLAVILLSIFMVFWSPLVYWIASPLDITGDVSRADIIAVFGGGVGESGRPGSSTIERAGYAAELYNAGMSRKIIFSSGYQSDRRIDSENMMKYSLAEGVDSNDIIIDSKAANNYQNVVNTLSIMDSLNVKNAIIVTGKYNSLRTKLILRKLTEQNNKLRGNYKLEQFAILCPTSSLYFGPGVGNRLSQYSAVLHEFAAIVYYWWQGKL